MYVCVPMMLSIQKAKFKFRQYQVRAVSPNCSSKLPSIWYTCMQVTEIVPGYTCVHLLHVCSSCNFLFLFFSLPSTLTPTAENEQLSASYSALETKERETSFKLKELELKMKGVKEYFQEKERELHKRIEVGEVSRMRYEQLESEAQEKATMADQERQRERQELTELRDQITEIEKSYSNQIKNTELRAGDAIVSAVHCI